MTRPITLDAFIDLDKHVEIFNSSHPYKNGVKQIECLIMDTFGQAILYQYGLEGMAVKMSLQEITALISNPTYMVHPQYSAIRMVNFTDRDNFVDRLVVYIMNPVAEPETIVAAWCVDFDYHTAIIHREKYIQDFEFHYFENLIHHLQMVMINYEKLYYIIDVYTELLISKDRFMPYHMTNVANWCMMMAMEINLPAKDQYILYVAALIHDIGKLFVSDELINREGKLEPDEFEIMKHHSERGYQMALASLYGMTFFQHVPEIIRHHHERFDGKGYPAGISGNAIPFLSRILAICDSVDAMMSRRSFKDKYGVGEILTELSKCSGTQFDPILTNHMIKLIMDQTSQKSDSSIGNTHFVPQASINFYYKDVKTQHSISGNLVIKEGQGKIIVHDGLSIINDLEVEHIYRCTLSYYQLTDFYEYTIDLEAIIKDQIYITNIKPLPTDKYFSTVWDGEIHLSGTKIPLFSANLVKLGGDSVVFEAHGKNAILLQEHRNDSLVGELDLSIEDTHLSIKVDLKIIKYYTFSGQATFVAKYMNIATSERDRIIRMLFKKQMQLKLIKKGALEKTHD